MLYLISYDIPDNKRRLRVASLLLDSGERVQESVFECHLEPAQYKTVLMRLRRVLVDEEDSLRVYCLCAECAKRIEVFGQGRRSTPPDLVII